MGDPRDRTRRLLVRYLGQLAERGERELYLSEDAARALREGLRDVAPAQQRAPEVRTAAALKAAPAARPGNAASSPKHAASSAAPTAAPEEIPEPEVVDVTLAFSTTAASPDMFAEPSLLDGCSTMADVERISSTCEKCELSRGRTKVVFGVGNETARLMFIGEAPGRDEDIQGTPFVGRAGQLLDKILAAAEIERDDVYIGNIIKCRPPNNRTPLTNEIEACIPYLAKQVGFIKPTIICTLGLPATQTLLGIRGSMGGLRGKIYRSEDLRVIPTYHPAAALRDPKYKRPIWEDILLIKREYQRG
jgi:uracil-DNA glycosylase family 4